MLDMYDAYRIKGCNVTFNEWLETSPSANLRGAAKEVETKLLRLVELAYTDAHGIGYHKGYDEGYNVGYQVGRGDALNEGSCKLS